MGHEISSLQCPSFFLVLLQRLQVLQRPARLQCRNVQVDQVECERCSAFTAIWYSFFAMRPLTMTIA